uniref:Uncharacterized protein n=1 Tax=Rhabditophanes sp. KR3021 TaxID=114890 RepID=A0AC35TT16_9BILA
MLSCFRKEWRDRKEIKETTSLLVPKDKATLIDLSTNKSTLIGTNLLVPTKCDPFGLVEEGEPSAGALFESLKESVSYVWFLPHDLLEEEGGEYVYGEESSRPAKEETTEMEESFSKFTDKMNESEFKCIWKYKRDFDSTSDPWKQLYSTLNSATNSTPNSTLNAVST